MPFESGTLQWDFDGNGEFDDSYFCSQSQCPVAQWTYFSPGDYDVHLRASVLKKGEGIQVVEITKTINISINPSGPVADFSFSPNPAFPTEMVNFNATDNSSLGLSVSYDWDFEYDGVTPTFDFSDITPEATHAYSTDGTYTVLLRVTDIDGNSVDTTQTVNVSQVPDPIADFSVPTGNILIGQSITLTSSSAAAVGNTIVSTQWDNENDGSFDLSGESVQLTYTTPGIHNMRLMVTDNMGLTAEVTKPITIVQAPTAGIDFSPANPLIGQTITLNTVSTANNSGGSITEQQWDFENDGTFDATGNSVQTSFSSPGDYTVKLQVTDNLGLTAEAFQTFTVLQEPTVGMNVTPATLLTDQAVTFTSTSTANNNGSSILNHKWDFSNDGTFDASGEVVQHTFSSPGSYNVLLQVTDNLGLSSSITKVITVLQPPTATYSLSNVSVKPDDLIDVDATASTDDGSIVSYQWDYTNDGTFDDSGSTIQISYASTGTYALRLRVTDNDGLTSDLTKTIQVGQPWTGNINLYAGNSHICGYDIGNSNIYCWGENNSGQIGDGSLTNRLLPTFIMHIPGFSDFSSGDKHSCALNTNGAIYCWGSNAYGQLGDNTTNDHATPAVVNGLTDYLQLALGDNHSCGLTFSGDVYCWGHNNAGQIGDGSNTDRIQPVQVNGAINFMHITAGAEHTCGIAASGDIYCWGNNSNGQLGDGTTINRNIPTLLSTGNSFVSISGGGQHTCALDYYNYAYCWGDNAYGQLGDSTTITRLAPTLVTDTGFSTLAEISAGATHTCASNHVDIFCWGDNSSGALGDGNFVSSSQPQIVDGVTSDIPLTAGNGFSCISDTVNGVYCWGSNDSGQLGIGSTQGPQTVPVMIPRPY